jgi:hypothetical protein
MDHSCCCKIVFSRNSNSSSKRKEEYLIRGDGEEYPDFVGCVVCGRNGREEGGRREEVNY